MKKYNYNAIDNKINQKCNGIISAETTEEAILKLLIDNKFVISIQELSESMELAELRLQNLKALKNKLSNKKPPEKPETTTAVVSNNSSTGWIIVMLCLAVMVWQLVAHLMR